MKANAFQRVVDGSATYAKEPSSNTTIGYMTPMEFERQAGLA